MLRIRIDNEWNHTARILAMMAEINRDPKRRKTPFTFQEFHPLHCGKVARGKRLTGDVLRAQAAAWRQQRGRVL